MPKIHIDFKSDGVEHDDNSNSNEYISNNGEYLQENIIGMNDHYLRMIPK